MNDDKESWKLSLDFPRILLKTFTATNIGFALYFIFYYLGENFLNIADENIEGFRIHGKPFVGALLSVLQLFLFIAIPLEIKRNKIYDIKGFRKRHNINLDAESYYGIMLDRIQNIRRNPKLANRGLWYKRKKGQSNEEYWKKVSFRFNCFTILMIVVPITNLLIHLSYIIEYTINVDLPLPDFWINMIQKVIGWLEICWQIPGIAIMFCIIEIFICAYIYITYFGIPFSSTD